MTILFVFSNLKPPLAARPSSSLQTVLFNVKIIRIQFSFSLGSWRYINGHAYFIHTITPIPLIRPPARLVDLTFPVCVAHSPFHSLARSLPSNHLLALCLLVSSMLGVPMYPDNIRMLVECYKLLLNRSGVAKTKHKN